MECNRSIFSFPDFLLFLDLPNLSATFTAPSADAHTSSSLLIVGPTHPPTTSGSSWRYVNVCCSVVNLVTELIGSVLSSQLCDGGELTTVVDDASENAEPLDEQVIWMYLFQLVSALQHCHQPKQLETFKSPREIVHGDLKLPNRTYLSGVVSSKLCTFGKLIRLPISIASSRQQGSDRRQARGLWSQRCVKARRAVSKTSRRKYQIFGISHAVANQSLSIFSDVGLHGTRVVRPEIRRYQARRVRRHLGSGMCRQGVVQLVVRLT